MMLKKTDGFMRAVSSETLQEYFDSKLYAGMDYARKLTLAHSTIQKSDIERLTNQGFSDGEVLEINQVASYFNYVNRSVLGLGVNTVGDIVGLSPNESNDPDDWGHK